MDKVRFGIIGLGNMGGWHAQNIHAAPGAVLGAICDTDTDARNKLCEKLATKVPGFSNHQDLINSGTVDAILIAVPHYDHMPIAIDAFKKGVNVLVEKPIAVSVKAARQGIEAYHTALKSHPDLKFGIMFNQRTNPLYQKIRELVKDGELGEISRVTWLVTNWFRSWAYYGSGGWRATWKGEGGGVLINQCPHNLDLMQWVVNGLMPSRVTAVGAVGKTHPIEVEDEVSAIFEYPNGAIGHFVTSTGEFPGTNRLEICGSRGKIVAEDGKLKFHRTRSDVQEFNRSTKSSFPYIDTWNIDIPVAAKTTSEHTRLTEDYVQVVLKNKPNSELLAPGTEGIHGLEIGNAIMQSALTQTPVNIPVDGEAYDRFINDMAKKYAGKKTLETPAKTHADMASSFAR